MSMCFMGLVGIVLVVVGDGLPGWLAGALAVLALVAASCLAARLGRHQLPFIALALGCAVTSARPREEIPSDGPQSICGAVWSSDRQGGRVQLRLAAATVDGQAIRGRLTAYFQHLEHVPKDGAGVCFVAEVTRSRPLHNPSFQPRSPRPYARGLTAPLAAPRHAASWSQAVAIAARARIRFDQPAATGLYRALLLGDRASLDVATTWAFQDAGTAHLLAISGLHVALIGWGLYRWLLRLLVRVGGARVQVGRPRAWAAGFTLLGLVGYAAIVGNTPSVTRALIFVGVVLLAIIAARRAMSWRTLLLALVVMGLIDPWQLTTAGFQLSFAAAAALVLGSPRLGALKAWVDRPGRFERAITRRAVFGLLALMWVNLLTYAATAPLTVAWFGQLAPWGLAINLVAVPALAFVVLPTGILWLVLATACPPLGEALAAIPGTVGHAFVAATQEVARWAGPSSVSSWPLWLGLGLTGVFLALLVARPLALRAALAVGLGVGFVRPALGATRPLEVVALDVGHGDAIAVRFPGGGAMLVDTGGSWRGSANARIGSSVVQALRTLGVSRLDVLVITHGDHDHVGAAPFIAARMPIDELWLSPCSARGPAVDAVARHVLARGGRVRLLHRDAVLDAQTAEVSVLWPPAEILRPDGSCRLGRNDASVVLRLDYAGRSLLLTGDIEEDAERAIVRDTPAALRTDVLKAPHHGSRSGSTQALLDAAGADHILVSGVRGRAPMPPHEAILDRYHQAGATVWTTGDIGAVRVTVRGDGQLTVRPVRPP